MQPAAIVYLLLAATVMLACEPQQQLVIREAENLLQRGAVIEAEQLLLGLASILERAGSASQTCLPIVLNNLGSLNQDLGRYYAAERFYSRAFRIEEQQSSAGADISTTLDNLGSVYFETGRHRKAELVRLKALDLRVAQLGPNHPAVARIVQNLATQKYAQGRVEEASQLYGRALAIWRVSGLEDTAECATAFNGLGLIYAKAGDLDRATENVRRALDIWIRSSGVSVSAARAEANLAALLMAQGEVKAAEIHWRSAIRRAEQSTGSQTAITRDLLYRFMIFLRQIRRTAEARYVKARIAEIDKIGTDPSFKSAITDITELEDRRSMK
jgi:tetratricopeptide (TPR) repeat protein